MITIYNFIDYKRMNGKVIKNYSKKEINNTTATCYKDSEPLARELLSYCIDKEKLACGYINRYTKVLCINAIGECASTFEESPNENVILVIRDTNKVVLTKVNLTNVYQEVRHNRTKDTTIFERIHSQIKDQLAIAQEG